MGSHSVFLTQCQEWDEDLRVFFFSEDASDDQVRYIQDKISSLNPDNIEGVFLSSGCGSISRDETS